MEYRVYICYKRNTAEDYALHLWEGLNEFEINAFLDINDIPKTFKGTDAWWERRDQAIRDCTIFLMIVTPGFERSTEIKKEMSLADKKNKDFMCLRHKKLPPNIPIDYGGKHRNLIHWEQITFEHKAELLRKVFFELPRPKRKMAVKPPPPSKLPPIEEKRGFPLVHFNITQVIRNILAFKRKLPNVGFNIRNWSDSPIKARVKARVFLGGEDLGLIKGSVRGGKYMGYYDGKKVWNLNPGIIVFGNFNVPKRCTETDQNLRIKVSVTLIDIDRKKYKLLPVSWTFMRNENAWFLEPTSDC